MEIRADDDPDAMAFGCGIRHSLDAATVSEMYDPETGAFVCDRPMPSPSDENHIALCLLYNRDLGLQDPDIVELFLISGEAYIGEFVTMLEETGLKNIRWEFADDVPEEDSLQAYILRVLDQYGEPVPGVYVNFCTDTSCTLTQSDGTGTITFEGEPAAYHVQLLKVPGGYSTASGSDFYTRPAYGEWVLRVKKD